MGCGDGSSLAELRRLGFSRLYCTEIGTVEREFPGSDVTIYRLDDLMRVPSQDGTINVVWISHVQIRLQPPRDALKA
ncbi:hypothetical protein DDE18_01415 [Nocardioides gansuensis]|uniref:Methyltransferase type 11 domain-containing protein n=1 Tax=Nocardioides gansuensis TaxID=2138300 RepID=A0A2T8FF49_9ACTN|nr:methyltransferase domain-containing protein [Nocardioides gansuensis]PVG84315.1 hypothetical protein DDE18_01415 [Nocardioides gansuensis]